MLCQPANDLANSFSVVVVVVDGGFVRIIFFGVYAFDFSFKCKFLQTVAAAAVVVGGLSFSLFHFRCVFVMNAFVMSTEPIDTTRCMSLCFILNQLLLCSSCCVRCCVFVFAHVRVTWLSPSSALLMLLLCKCV